jgi:hypothetical protein
VPGIGRTPRRPMIPQDVADLQLRSRHTPALDEVDNTSIFKTGSFPRYPRSPLWDNAQTEPPAPLSRSVTQTGSAERAVQPD